MSSVPFKNVSAPARIDPARVHPAPPNILKATASTSPAEILDGWCRSSYLANSDLPALPSLPSNEPLQPSSATGSRKETLSNRNISTTPHRCIAKTGSTVLATLLKNLSRVEQFIGQCPDIISRRRSICHGIRTLNVGFPTGVGRSDLRNIFKKWTIFNILGA